MVTTSRRRKDPFGLVVSGEAETWLPALKQIVGSQLLVAYRANSDDELLDVIHAGVADAAVLDDAVGWSLDVLELLRMIRRLDEVLPVVIITEHRERRWLEDALRLAVFSVVARPLALEELLRQIQRMMERIDSALREDRQPPRG